jgi:hypothetical protein
MYHKTELENGCSKLVLTRPYSVEWVTSNLGGDPTQLFTGESDSSKNYDSEIHIITTESFSYPTIEDGEIREMSDYEKYEAGISTLSDGQYADSDTKSIITVECENIYSTWDSDNNEWVTDDDLYSAYTEEKMTEIRAKRSELLSSTDFYVMEDYPITDGNLALVEAYRQELRDLPSTITDVDDFEYPTFPTFA